MSLKTFESILDHVDPDFTTIHFSGFSEIFQHSSGHAMIARAYKRGFDIALFSTLAGFTSEKAALLSQSDISNPTRSGRRGFGPR